MAVDRKYPMGDLTLPNIDCTPTTVVSGGPCVVGKIPCVAAIDAVSSKTVPFISGVFDLSVKDVVGGTIAIGDIIYFDNTTTPKLNNTNTGIRFGYALEAIGAGLTDTINVLLGY